VQSSAAHFIFACAKQRTVSLTDMIEILVGLALALYALWWIIAFRIPREQLASLEKKIDRAYAVLFCTSAEKKMDERSD
jgi:hypothetical protein